MHVVGGGSQNTLLCQAIADRAGVPVVAGPVEATALGNVLVQARAAGVVGRRTSRTSGPRRDAPTTWRRFAPRCGIGEDGP